jgi:ABC-type uncharacterized transport system permease subunit
LVSDCELSGLILRLQKLLVSMLKKPTFLRLALSAAFVGIAAANQALSSTGGVTPTSATQDIGFDAITVALLGGSSASGVLLAGLLLGAFKAGSSAIQALLEFHLTFLELFKEQLFCSSQHLL